MQHESGGKTVEIAVPEVIESFSELGEVVVAAMAAHSRLSLVVGPLTTGGCGDRDMNTTVFRSAIHGLVRRGNTMFNQLPFEEAIQRLAHEWWKANPDANYCWPILEEFYRPVFESGAFHSGVAYAIPGWQASTGTRWELEHLPLLGVHVQYLSPEDIHAFLREAEIDDMLFDTLAQRVRAAFAAGENGVH